MFQQRISFCCQRISRRTRIFFVFFCVFCRFMSLSTDFTDFTDLIFCVFCVFCCLFFNIGFHGFHGFNYLCNLCNLLTFIIQFHVHFYLRVLRALRWKPHHVRCFTHLFCTFIVGKFEVSDWMAKSVSNR